MTLMVNPLGDGLTVSAGAAITASATPTVCGLPVMVIPLPSTADRETVSLYTPTARDAEVTVTVNVVLPPLMTAEVGVTANQLWVTAGVTVILPVQPPMIPIVKLWLTGLGFVPTSALRFSCAREAGCNVHAG